MELSNFLLASVDFVAKNERVEKERKASDTDKVPSALSFLPVNGKTSGPRCERQLMLTRLTKLTNGSIRLATSLESSLKILTCIPCDAFI